MIMRIPTIAVLALLFFVAMLAVGFAQGIAPVANGAIDQAQPAIAEWISTGVTSGAMVFLAWLGRRIGVKIVEKLNRDAIATACRNFANFTIDELQLRFLDSGTAAPDLSDLVERGLAYVSGGSKDAIKESAISTDRLRKQVEGALRDKGADLLSKALRDAGLPPAKP